MFRLLIKRIKNLKILWDALGIRTISKIIRKFNGLILIKITRIIKNN